MSSDLLRRCFIFVSLAVVCAFAHAGAKRLPKVAVVSSEANAAFVADVVAKISSSNVFSAVDNLDARLATPSLNALMKYDAVLVYSSTAMLDPVALGNRLADYVDAGGGVVSMSLTNSSVPLAGRWTSGYLIIDPTGEAHPNVSLGAVAIQTHPIMIGVTALAATQAFQSTGALVAGSTLVASWSNGTPLVATSTLPGRADLNFYPPSNAVNSAYWKTSGDGVKLMVNALLYTMRPRVIILGAVLSRVGTESNADVKRKIAGTGKVGIIDTMRVENATPTLSKLQEYDAALLYSELDLSNPAAMGNVLADYVDAGGGVVCAGYSAYNVNPYSHPQGRWPGTYRLMVGGAGIKYGAEVLGNVPSIPHPATAGVVSFYGGTSSGRPTSNALYPGAVTVATWDDNTPLVVTSTKFFNRIDLGFFPPSSAVSPDFWDPFTNGDDLMANALLCVSKPFVTCIAADGASQMSDVVNRLVASRRFSGVYSYTATNTTPAASLLQYFGAALTWSNSPYADPTAMGGALSDFVDAGGGVVTALFANTTVSPLEGRWITGGYEITPSPVPGYLSSGTQSLGTILEPDHPIASFVRRFDGNTKSYRQDTVPTLRGRTVMRWSDGKMLTSVHNFMKRADLGYWPVSSGSSSNWNQRTDGTWITANALEYVVRSRPCPGDLNGDGVVDDVDFVLFAAYYDALVEPRGDFTGDGYTDDSDFVAFADAYNTLTCP
ncbi:MAG: hypothetical protein J0L78_08795 [Planctomycetes bacterium]|nr:hypothetical protein [Planctomycetota bacterium]